MFVIVVTFDVSKLVKPVIEASFVHDWNMQYMLVTFDVLKWDTSIEVSALEP